MGTADTITSYTSDDQRAFYTATFRTNNAALLVVGDVQPDRVLPLLESNFGKWEAQGGSAPQARLPSASEPDTRTIYLVDKPGAAQSQIRIGWIGVPRSTPDFFPIQVMNTILGGSFSSRLNMNLREKHGYTYGASSFFDLRLEPGPFTAYAGVQTDTTTDPLNEFSNAFERIQRPVPAEER